MADISKIKLPNNSEYNVKDSGAIRKNETGNTQQLRRPSYLQGANDVTIDSKINTLRANRLAFLPADQIIIEKTVDGGTTWTDAEISDAVKTQLFSEVRPSITLPRINGKKSPLCGLRITITAMKYNVPSGTAETQKYNYWNSNYIKSTERYNQLKEMYFWVSVSGGYINVKVERATGANPNTWVSIFNNPSFNMTGYTGNDYISFTQGVFGGGTTQTGNYWNYRITLMTADNIPAAPYDGYSQSISEIRGYGDTWWTAGNEYAANDKMYTHDYLKNVQFPAYVTATQFNGALNGLAVKARRLEGVDTRNTNENPSWYVTNYPYGIVHEFKTTSAIGVSSILDTFYYCDLITMIPYADGSGGYPVQIAQNYASQKRAIRYATSASAWGAWHDMSDASTVNSHTVNADVPSGAKFTDTTYTGTSPITVSNANVIGINTASTSGYGATKLNTATNSTSTTEAATPSAVKTAYDLANTANGTANTALSGVNGTLIYDHTYSISNGVATFTAHVYQKGVEVTSNYADSCFSWSYKLANAVTGTPSVVSLGTGKTKTITISTLGYGGYVLGTFTPPA